jgi:tetratricopeptide (TPR) repeat protein
MTQRMIAGCFAFTFFFVWMIEPATAQTTPPVTSPAAKSALKDLKADAEKESKSRTKSSDEPLTPEAKDLTEAAKKFSASNFDGALKILQDMVKKYPDLPPPQVYMASFFSRVQSIAGMRGALEQAVIDAPNDPEPYILMGDVAVNEHRFTEARMLYKKAEELTASFQGSKKRKEQFSPRILSGEALIEEFLGNWALAQKLLEQCAQLDSKDARVFLRLGHVLFMLKNPTAALERLKEATKIDPEIGSPDVLLGQFYEQNDDHENAKKCMAEALRLSPKDIRIRYSVARWAFDTNQLQDAKTQVAEALKLDPKSVDALVLSGTIAMFLKDYPAAERFFETAHIQSPRNFAASNNLALVLAEQDDEAKRKRAMEFAQSNVQANPRSAMAASTYGWVCYKLGKIDDAEKALKAAISSGANMPDTAYYMAVVAYDRARESEAKEWLDVALKVQTPFANRQEAEALLEKLKK